AQMRSTPLRTSRYVVRTNDVPILLCRSFGMHLLTQSTLFPYTTLFRSHPYLRQGFGRTTASSGANCIPSPAFCPSGPSWPSTFGDRKSTRLNSSHGSTSYAVFCFKKKNAWKNQPVRVVRQDPDEVDCEH